MNSDELHFFNPYTEIRHTENRLPHWQQNGAVYFVTFRLVDAIPKHLRDQWESERSVWLRFHPKPWSAEIEHEYHDRFAGAIERWLDAGHGSCILRRADCAEIVGNALRHFEGDRYAQVAWVVMPNHVHLLFIQRPEWPLEALLHSWKRFTARRINEVLGAREACGSATILTGLFVTKNTLPTVCATFGTIRRRRGLAKANTCYMKAPSRNRLNNKEGRFVSALGGCKPPLPAPSATTLQAPSVTQS